ncbi:hypothetical protein [Xanthovirga aplysinae]|uniref:hypothetical protein n=1 Tax=Xanthovirga aplysinae TaxID=2529853 RepID=UPI0012BBBDB5|nr:hypothetical protein [Xanthovirga aplysinae]MTI29416.1 hypothetical protein [Xanthovirga aplysinae]
MGKMLKEIEQSIIENYLEIVERRDNINQLLVDRESEESYSLNPDKNDDTEALRELIYLNGWIDGMVNTLKMMGIEKFDAENFRLF